MKIFETAYVPNDGGAVWLKSSNGQLYIDTEGKIWGGFPRPDRGNLLNPRSQAQAKQDILSAEFVHHKNGFAHIEKLLNQSDKPKEETLQTVVPTVSTMEEPKS